MDDHYVHRPVDDEWPSPYPSTHPLSLGYYTSNAVNPTMLDGYDRHSSSSTTSYISPYNAAFFPNNPPLTFDDVKPSTSYLDARAAHGFPVYSASPMPLRAPFYLTGTPTSYYDIASRSKRREQAAAVEAAEDEAYYKVALSEMVCFPDDDEDETTEGTGMSEGASSATVENSPKAEEDHEEDKRDLREILGRSGATLSGGADYARRPAASSETAIGKVSEDTCGASLSSVQSPLPHVDASSAPSSIASLDYDRCHAAVLPGSRTDHDRNGELETPSFPSRSEHLSFTVTPNLHSETAQSLSSTTLGLQADLPHPAPISTPANTSGIFMSSPSSTADFDSGDSTTVAPRSPAPTATTISPFPSCDGHDHEAMDISNPLVDIVADVELTFSLPRISISDLDLQSADVSSETGNIMDGDIHAVDFEVAPPNADTDGGDIPAPGHDSQGTLDMTQVANDNGADGGSSDQFTRHDEPFLQDNGGNDEPQAPAVVAIKDEPMTPRVDAADSDDIMIFEPEDERAPKTADDESSVLQPEAPAMEVDLLYKAVIEPALLSDNAIPLQDTVVDISTTGISPRPDERSATPPPSVSRAVEAVFGPPVDHTERAEVVASDAAPSTGMSPRPDERSATPPPKTARAEHARSLEIDTQPSDKQETVASVHIDSRSTGISPRPLERSATPPPSVVRAVLARSPSPPMQDILVEEFEETAGDEVVPSTGIPPRPEDRSTTPPPTSARALHARRSPLTQSLTEEAPIQESVTIEGFAAVVESAPVLMEILGIAAAEPATASEAQEHDLPAPHEDVSLSEAQPLLSVDAASETERERTEDSQRSVQPDPHQPDQPVQRSFQALFDTIRSPSPSVHMHDPFISDDEQEGSHAGSSVRLRTSISLPGPSILSSHLVVLKDGQKLRRPRQLLDCVLLSPRKPVKTLRVQSLKAFSATDLIPDYVSDVAATSDVSPNVDPPMSDYDPSPMTDITRSPAHSPNPFLASLPSPSSPSPPPFIRARRTQLSLKRARQSSSSLPSSTERPGKRARLTPTVVHRSPSILEKIVLSDSSTTHTVSLGDVPEESLSVRRPGKRSSITLVSALRTDSPAKKPRVAFEADVFLDQVEGKVVRRRSSEGPRTKNRLLPLLTTRRRTGTDEDEWEDLLSEELMSDSEDPIASWEQVDEIKPVRRASSPGVLHVDLSRHRASSISSKSESDGLQDWSEEERDSPFLSLSPSKQRRVRRTQSERKPSDTRRKSDRNVKPIGEWWVTGHSTKERKRRRR